MTSKIKDITLNGGSTRAANCGKTTCPYGLNNNANISLEDHRRKGGIEIRSPEFEITMLRHE
jgi:hypothetical protein